MSQPIKYWTTKVPASRSIRKIKDIIRDAGGGRFEEVWDGEGGVLGIRFTLPMPQADIAEVPIALEVDVDKVLDRIWQSYSRSHRRRTDVSREDYRDRAERIAWRHVKDLAEQMTLAVELGTFDLMDLFGGMVVVRDPDTGERKTMGRLMGGGKYLSPGAGGALLLPSGDG